MCMYTYGHIAELANDKLSTLYYIFGTYINIDDEENAHADMLVITASCGRGPLIMLAVMRINIYLRNTIDILFSILYSALCVNALQIQRQNVTHCAEMFIFPLYGRRRNEDADTDAETQQQQQQRERSFNCQHASQTQRHAIYTPRFSSPSRSRVERASCVPVRFTHSVIHLTHNADGSCATMFMSSQPRSSQPLYRIWSSHRISYCICMFCICIYFFWLSLCSLFAVQSETV